MYEITVRKRDLFFKYLEEEGLVPELNYNILEIAPNVLLSQSLLLVEKYGDLYKQFLVSKSFQDGYDSYPNIVKGVRGTVLRYDDDVRIDAFNNRIRSFFAILFAGSFDTILIQGQPYEAYNLAKCSQSLLFGDVCEIGDRETRNIYNDLFGVIARYSYYGSYELSHETDSIEGSEYYLIRKKAK